jgi:hypothetical protein
MPESKRQNERLIVVFIVGVIALNYPLLSLFSKIQLLFGVPVLYLYLFFLWSLFIIGVAITVERSP